MQRRRMRRATGSRQRRPMMTAARFGRVTSTRNARYGTFNGFLTLAIALALVAGAAWLIVGMARGGRPDVAAIVGGDPAVHRRRPAARRASTRCSPTRRAILQLFGAYRGTTARRRPALRPTRSTPAGRSRCAPATSTASGSRSTTSAATRSRSPPSSSGASTTRPRRSSTSTTTRCTCKRAGRGRRPPPRLVVRLRRGRQPPGRDPRADAARQRRRRRQGARPRARRPASTRPASSSRRRGSPTSPTPPRSRR